MGLKYRLYICDDNSGYDKKQNEVALAYLQRPSSFLYDCHMWSWLRDHNPLTCAVCVLIKAKESAARETTRKCPNVSHVRCHHSYNCCGKHDGCVRKSTVLDSHKLNLGVVYGDTVHEIEANARKQAAEFFNVNECEIVIEVDNLCGAHNSSISTLGRRYYAYMKAHRK